MAMFNKRLRTKYNRYQGLKNHRSNYSVANEKENIDDNEIMLNLDTNEDNINDLAIELDLDQDNNDDIMIDIDLEGEDEKVKVTNNSEAEIEIIINDNDESMEDESMEDESMEDESMEEIKKQESALRKQRMFKRMRMKQIAKRRAQANEEFKQTVDIEINSPESVVIAPETLSEENLPEELSEQITVEDIINQTPQKITYNLAHLLTKDEFANDIEVIASSLNDNNPSYYLMVKNVPVAVAEFKNASSEIQSMFTDRDLFMKSLQVVLSSAQQADTNMHLKDFGIRPIIKTLVSAEAAVQNRIVAVTKALVKEFKEKEEQMFNNFRESFTTAAVIHCKNLHEVNPVEEKRPLISKSLISDILAEANVANASLVADNVFKNGFINDYAVIVKTALALYTKSPEARHEVMNFVTKASYKSDASLDSNQANEID